MIEVLNNLAIEAGQAIKKIKLEEVDFNIEYKEDSTPLTKADLASNKIIVNGLKKHFPNIPIISEESSIEDFSTRKDWHEFFLIDPLDGTKEFIKKRDEFTVNIAYLKKNLPELGVVYAPMNDHLYFGGPNASYLRINQSEKKLPSLKYKENNLIVIVSRSHINEKTQSYIDELKEQYSNIEIKRVGSSLKICQIADGEADLYPRLGPICEWDTAAAHAILLGAGGDIIRLKDNQPLTYNKEDIHHPNFVAIRKEIVKF